MLIFVVAIQNNISHPDHDWGGRLHEAHAMLAGYLEKDGDLKQFSLASQGDISKAPPFHRYDSMLLYRDMPGAGFVVSMDELVAFQNHIMAKLRRHIVALEGVYGVELKIEFRVCCFLG
jgi:hypothetical protein